MITFNLPKISSTQLIISVAIFFIATVNNAFFSHVLEIYPLNSKNIGFLITLVTGFTSAIILLLTLLGSRFTLKPLIIALLIISSFTAYFMDSYNAVIDESMLQNILNTDIHESFDLLSFKLIVYVTFLGILPAYTIYKLPIAFQSTLQEFFSKLKLITLVLSLVLISIFTYSNFFSSFWREHKSLRYYANPSFYLYSSGKYLSLFFKSQKLPLQKIGVNAFIPKSNDPKRLVIFVVGETARADHFSLNGYHKKTTPLLEQEKELINFSNFWSCGTSTAVSVPCLFSRYNSDEYSKEKAISTENVLDVIQRAGVSVLWLDNNSSSIGVATRVPYQSYKSSATNPVCDIECRDIGMLANLQSYINQQNNKDIIIILHQMGNHGPAYYKRYPKEFEKFTPTCKTNQLEDCDTLSLNNTYDNIILYTDYFLSEVISLLKENDTTFKTALFYVSDHGESLGENGLYLHGLPNFIAPDSQRHVPALLWFGKQFNHIDTPRLLQNIHKEYSHDHIFHTLLGLMNINTSVYNEKMDFIPKKPLPTPLHNIPEHTVNKS